MPKRNLPRGKRADTAEASAEVESVIKDTRRLAVRITDACLRGDMDKEVAASQSVCGAAQDIASRLVSEIFAADADDGSLPVGSGASAAQIQAVKTHLVEDLRQHITLQRGDYLAHSLGIDDRLRCADCGGKHWQEPHPAHIQMRDDYR